MRHAKREETGSRDNPLLQETLQHKEMEAERRINGFRIAIGIVAMLTAAVEVAAVGRPREAVLLLVGFVPFFAAYCWAMYRFTTPGVYRPRLKYVSITIDWLLVLLVFTGMEADGAMARFFGPEGQGAAVVMLLLLLVALSALRHSPGAILYAAALTLAGSVWAALYLGHSAFLASHSVLVVVLLSALVLYHSLDVRRLVIRLQQREALTRFLPREVIQSIDRGELSLELGGEERRVTLLLTDIRGFTTLAEHMPPGELIDLLNAYLTRMSAVIFRWGGTLDKFIGDAILAVFGAPVSHEDDAVRAVRAALQMSETLAELNLDLAARGLPVLRTGTALHTGMVVAGNVGSTERMEYTVIGDTVNLVARVEELNKTYGTDLLMTEQTHALAGHGVPGDWVGETLVRGRDQPVRLYGRRVAPAG
ncbi:MAG TPA: adenylate/guanylate cyclase domain-containing protein [bacterium]|nr:adenylate/guanylate cyclase domain-containing protein [bacterium]